MGPAPDVANDNGDPDTAKAGVAGPVPFLGVWSERVKFDFPPARAIGDRERRLHERLGCLRLCLCRLFGPQIVQWLLFDIGQDAVDPAPGLVMTEPVIRIAHPEMPPSAGRIEAMGLMVAEGRRTELVGKIQERYGIARDEAEKQVDTWMRNM